MFALPTRQHEKYHENMSKYSIKKNCPKMDFWLKIHLSFKILFMRWTFDKECNQFKLQIAMDNNGMDIVCYTYFYQFQNTR